MISEKNEFKVIPIMVLRQRISMLLFPYIPKHISEGFLELICYISVGKHNCCIGFPYHDGCALSENVSRKSK